MKVLLLTTHINIGGIGVYTVNLAKYLNRYGVEVSVISSGGDLEGFLSCEGIEHTTMDIRTKSEFGSKVFKAVIPLARFIKENDIDIVHAQTRVTQVLACMSGALTGVPLVSTCHGFFKHRRLGRRVFPCWGEKVIAISRKVEEHLHRDFGVSEQRVRQVYNGIELSRFLGHGKEASLTVALKRKIGLSENALVVGTVGRFSPVKGHSCLLRAFDKICDPERNDLQLLLVGDSGGEKEKLCQLTERLGLSGRVFFEDGTKATLEEYLGIMDIFCLPSLQEGLGISLMEAMASGCACVASAVGGVTELIDEGTTGVLVPPGDVSALSEALGRIIKDKDLRARISSAAREEAEQRFAIEDSVKKTIQVYEDVIEERYSG